MKEGKHIIKESTANYVLDWPGLVYRRKSKGGKKPKNQGNREILQGEAGEKGSNLREERTDVQLREKREQKRVRKPGSTIRKTEGKRKIHKNA